MDWFHIITFEIADENSNDRGVEANLWPIKFATGVFTRLWPRLWRTRRKRARLRQRKDCNLPAIGSTSRRCW